MNQQTKRREAAGVLPARGSIADNEDLLTEILERLPAKSTIRFKSVCTDWLNLIYFSIDEVFDRAYSFSLDGCQGNLPPLSFLDGLKGGSRVRVRVMHSSNGLLLCSMPIECDVSERHQEYLVCNPTTNKYRLLPQPVGLRRRTAVFLAFDPTKSPLHYKVVLFSRNPFRVEIYRSQSLCWKEVYPDQEYSSRSVFWNGAIHWLTNDDILRRFDVDGEKIIAVPNPPLPEFLGQKKIMYFGECGGGLILIIQSGSWPLYPSEFLILELEKDYSCWFINARVDLNPLIAEFPRMISTKYGYNVLGAVEGENESGLALLLSTSSGIIFYNLQNMTWIVLYPSFLGESRKFGLQSSVFPFVETLFPV